VVFGNALFHVVNLVAAHQRGQPKHAAGQEHARLVVEQPLRVHYQHRQLLAVGLQETGHQIIDDDDDEMKQER